MTLHSFPTRRSSDLFEREPPVRRHARACPGHPRLYDVAAVKAWMAGSSPAMTRTEITPPSPSRAVAPRAQVRRTALRRASPISRSEEHTSELQSPYD